MLFNKNLHIAKLSIFLLKSCREQKLSTRLVRGEAVAVSNIILAGGLGRATEDRCI